MYDVVFKIVVEPDKKYDILKYRSNTFANYLRKKLKGYNFTKHKYYDRWYTFELVSDYMKIEKYDIDAYYNSVDAFKSFVDNEYNNILDHGHNFEIYGYMCIYDKDMYNKNKTEDWLFYNHYKENNKMPDYNTILQYYCESKLYDPKDKTIRSYFDSYNEIYKEITNNKDLSNIIDVSGKLYSSVYFGREEIINGFNPKYKIGDVVEYEGRISIIRDAPTDSPEYGDKYINMKYQIDFIYDNKSYCWYCDRDIRDCDLKPYTGEVPEFMKLLQKAVLEQDGYHIVIGKNDDLIDDLLYGRDIITEFDDFKDELISILTSN